MKVKLTNPVLDENEDVLRHEIRGGSWYGIAWVARASFRKNYGPSNIDPFGRDHDYIGFRLVRNK
jgi:formylglycine-generating enzyme required for sulfatase activity